MTTIRNSTKRFDKPFLFLANAELLEEARRTAAKNEMSVAALVRQAVLCGAASPPMKTRNDRPQH